MRLTPDVAAVADRGGAEIDPLPDNSLRTPTAVHTSGRRIE
jgi:hypothetical protein